MTAQAVTTHRQADLPAISETATILQVIERAAANPNVDIDKMERLFEMRERALDRGARVAFHAALAKMQPKLPVISERGRIEVPAKDGKTGHSTPFALWEDINDAIRPLLAQNGFALSFRVGMAQDGKIEVTGVLSHKEGHSEQTTITLMHDSSGSKNAVQAVGSSTSYGKRYTAMALLNITTRGEDDDGKSGGARGMSEAAKKAIETINSHKTHAEHLKWRNDHAEGVEKLVEPAEWKEIAALWNRRAKALRAPAGPVTDFPGDRR